MKKIMIEDKEFGSKKIKKASIIYILACSICLVFSVFMIYAFDTNNDLKEALIRNNVEYATLQKEHQELMIKYKESILKKDTGYTCIVSYSPRIRRNTVVVKNNNRFNLKNGDRVKLTYHNRQITTTIEFFVLMNSATQETDHSDFIISKHDLQILTNQKRFPKGIYNMILTKCEK